MKSENKLLTYDPKGAAPASDVQMLSGLKKNAEAIDTIELNPMSRVNEAAFRGRYSSVFRLYKFIA